MTDNTKSIALAGTAVLSWATVATAFKIALGQLTVYNMLLVATVTATLIYAVMMSIEGRWKGLAGMPGKLMLEAMALGLLNPTVYYLVLFQAYDMLPAQVAQPVNYAWPIFLLVLLAVFNHEKIPARKYIGMAISVGGVVCISMGGGGVEGSLSVGGILMAALSAALWAIYWMVNDRLKGRLDTTTSLFLGFATGSVMLVAGGLVSGAIDVRSTEGLLSGIYIGCFEMGIPFLTFGMALRITKNPALVNQMCYLSPFLSLFLIGMVLGEKIAPATYAGLALIVAGLVYNQYFVKEKA
ncbi:MAG: DMT family transporter [Muribaculaceae bacterium]|nr:DMT family transporter [Muribaculaceae bacterium]